MHVAQINFLRAPADCSPEDLFERWPSLPYLRDHYGYEELSFAPGLLRTFSPRDFDLTVTCGYPYTNWVLRWRRHGQRNDLAIPIRARPPSPGILPPAIAAAAPRG